MSRLLTTVFGIAAAMLLLGVQPAHAQCNDAGFDRLFQSTFGRSPNPSGGRVAPGALPLPWNGGLIECDPHRYSDASALSAVRANDLQASVVCQDPWIAEAYMSLGRQLNGHDAWKKEASGYYSTDGNCNQTTYGSWSSFSMLKQNIAQHFAPVAQTAPSTLSVKITSPPSFPNNAAWLVQWTVSGTPAPTQCPVNVILLLPGGKQQLATNVPLAQGRAQIQAMNWSATYPNGLNASLYLMDTCTGNALTPALFPIALATTAAPASQPLQLSVAPGQFTSVGPITGVNGQGYILDGRHQPISSAGPGYFFLDISSGALVASGGGNYAVHVNGQQIQTTSASVPHGVLVDNYGNPVKAQWSGTTWQLVARQPLVASGAGNLVASGAGNLVASGAGNLVASGAGNLVASGAGNLVASGAGNLVASGAGNLVASGAGNLQVLQPSQVLSSDRQPLVLDTLTLSRLPANLISDYLRGPARTVLSVGTPAQPSVNPYDASCQQYLRRSCAQANLPAAAAATLSVPAWRQRAVYQVFQDVTPSHRLPSSTEYATWINQQTWGSYAQLLPLVQRTNPR